VEGRTLFRGIQLLAGGSLWSFANGSCSKKRYFSSVAWESQPALSIESFESEFQETFKRVLPRYFESESGIGISLTAGLDTRMIMACRPETVPKPVCYTFSGEKGLTLDDRLAARVAETCGLAHRLLRIGSDFFLDFAGHADRTVFVTDGCFGILGAHEIYLNRQARQLAPVRLTGNYGSEILRGVSTFKRIGLSPNLFDSEFSSTLNSLPGSTAHEDEHPVTFAAFREIPLNLFGSLAAGRSQTTFRTPYLDNQMVALAYRSPISLRTSPGAALRLIKDNSAALSNIPTDMGLGGQNSGLSAVLKRLFAKVTFKLDYLHNEGFPHWLSPFDSLFENFASGLGVLGLHKYLHYRRWFRRELAGYINDVVADARTQRIPFWNSDFLECMASEHIRGRKNYVREINAVLTLEAVERLLFRNLPYRLGERDDFGIRTVPSVAVKQA
jgi:asparagine synthase (glutamine-hydrolysing)